MERWSPNSDRVQEHAAHYLRRWQTEGRLPEDTGVEGRPLLSLLSTTGFSSSRRLPSRCNRKLGVPVCAYLGLGAAQDLPRPNSQHDWRRRADFLGERWECI